MGKTKGTPDELDYLFERDIIDEEDYIEFWSQYWKMDEFEREELITDYLEIANTNNIEGQTDLKLSGVVTELKTTAVRQAKAIGGVVVRRNKQGRFSKTGKRYQAVKRGARREKAQPKAKV